jgi:glutathione synthase/RimK-type ligase-like ATP-grasp enzyme
MKKITLLTSLELDGYIHDDHLLVSELEVSGYFVQSKPWETLQDEGEDLFIIRTTWNYTEHFEKFVTCLESIEDRLWNPLPLIKWNANKKYLVDLYQKGLDIMPLCLAEDSMTLELSLNELGGDDFIAKPLIGASARGLIRFNRSSLPDLNEEVIIQKFYPEITKGEVSLIYFSGYYAYAVKKTPKAGDIRVQEEHGGLVTSYSPSVEELKMATDALEHIPEKWLYARVDIIPGVGIIELECIEPSLFFSRCEDGAKPFVEAISKKVK